MAEEMNKEEYRAMMMTVAYLCGCAARKTIPDPKELDGTDLEKLYEAAEKHLVTAAVGMALESAGMKTHSFEQAVAQAQRKNALLDADRAKVLAGMEKAGIWYMPLKGSVLKDMYPRYGMRQMSDNDILIDPERRADVRTIMEGIGFKTEKYEAAEHDVYHKKPVSNFEMHVYLVNGRSNAQLETYYLNVKDRLIKDEGNNYGYHFRDEDFYLYMIVHEYKHYIQGGTGLRSLMDTYVYLLQKQETLDWDYIRQEAEKMGIAEYESVNRTLAMHLFAGEVLSESEDKMLQYVFSSGTYGTEKNAAINQVREKGRFGYFLARLTLPKKEMYWNYPILKKAPFLYPVMWGWRLISKPVIRFKSFTTQLKAVLGIIKPDDE